MCIAAAFLTLLISCGTPLADDDSGDIGIKLMTAATVTLSTLTFPVGHVVVMSADLAKSNTGAVYRKISDCIYGLEEGGRSNPHIEIVNFSGLTGRYDYSAAPMMGINLVFSGRDPRTRCFQIADNKGCQYNLQLSHVDPSMIQRLIDDVSYITRTACPLKQTDPY